MATLYMPTVRADFYHDRDGYLATTKREDEIDSYTIDWSDALESGETVASVVNTVDGVTLDAESNTTTTATITVSDTDGELEMAVTTSAGRVLETVLRFIGY